MMDTRIIYQGVADPSKWYTEDGLEINPAAWPDVYFIEIRQPKPQPQPKPTKRTHWGAMKFSNMP